MELNFELVAKRAIEFASACYEKEQELLKRVGIVHKTEGEIRYAAGELVEHVLQSVFDAINTFLEQDKIISKVGRTDYLNKKIIYKGEEFINDKIQVDRHVWYKGKRIALIEKKTYLYSCYYERALADFKKIAQSLFQHGQNPLDSSFIVFAGQKAGKDNTLLTYEAEFWSETKSLTNDVGIVPNTIYFLKGIRSSAKPLYKIKHIFNQNAIINLVKLILPYLE